MTLAVVIAIASGAYWWTRPASSPAVPISTEHPYEVMTRILEQVYLAFGEETEEAIYDALADVAEGEVLTELYLQRRQSLVSRNFTDDTTAIHGVELLFLDLNHQGNRWQARARWQVIGSVGHEEHEHLRGNTYEADLTLQRGDAGMKIKAFELLDVVRNNGDDDRG
ncbi:MAG: hypothetical protein ACX931_09000 [Saccharospirillum sp.]